jgi:hypothetical protein
MPTPSAMPATSSKYRSKCLLAYGQLIKRNKRTLHHYPFRNPGLQDIRS